MIDIQKRPLTAFKENDLVLVERPVEQQAGVGDIRPQHIGVLEQLVGNDVDVQCSAVVDLDQDLVLLVESAFDLLPQD